jgi:hypothetical protein
MSMFWVSVNLEHTQGFQRLFLVSSCLAALGAAGDEDSPVRTFCDIWRPKPVRKGGWTAQGEPRWLGMLIRGTR